MVVMVVLRSKGLQLLLRWPRHSLCREAKKMLTRSLLLSHGVREKDVASAQLRSSRIKTEGHLVPRMPAFGKFLSMKHMKRSPKDISWCHGRMSFPGNTTPGCWFLTRKVSWVWEVQSSVGDMEDVASQRCLSWDIFLSALVAWFSDYFLGHNMCMLTYVYPSLIR